MCLRPNRCRYNDFSLFDAKKAKKDITCFKVMKVEHYRIFFWFKRKKYSTPFQKVEVNNDIIAGKTAFNPAIQILIDGRSYSYMGRGAIHSYTNFNDANIVKQYLNGSHSCKNSVEYVVFQCRIPKGTLYLKGVDTNDYDSYGSDSLLFEKEL